MDDLRIVDIEENPAMARLREGLESRLSQDIVEYLSGNYSRKIVEIGVGNKPEIARLLKEALPTAQILVTDTKESVVRAHDRIQGIKAVADDIFAPSLHIYQGASLIYSINPPPEFLSAMEEVARNIGADLFVKPVSDEQDVFRDEARWRPVLVRGRQIGWLLRNRK